MNKTKQVMFAVLAILVLTSALISLVQATDDDPERTAVPDEPIDDSNGLVISPGNEQLYTIQDNRTAVDDNSTAEITDNNPVLISTQTAPDNSNFVILGIVIVVLAVSVGAITVLRRRQHATK